VTDSQKPIEILGTMHEVLELMQKQSNDQADKLKQANEALRVEPEKSWHLDKKTPQGLIFSLIVLALGGAYNISTADGNIKANTVAINNLKTDVITRESVNQLIQIQDIKMGAFGDSISEIRARQKEQNQDLKDARLERADIISNMNKGFSELKTLLISRQ